MIGLVSCCKKKFAYPLEQRISIFPPCFAMHRGIAKSNINLGISFPQSMAYLSQMNSLNHIILRYRIRQIWKGKNGVERSSNSFGP
jgi:hypothetical protein